MTNGMSSPLSMPAPGCTERFTADSFEGLFQSLVDRLTQHESLMRTRGQVVTLKLSSLGSEPIIQPSKPTQTRSQAMLLPDSEWSGWLEGHIAGLLDKTQRT